MYWQGTCFSDAVVIRNHMWSVKQQEYQWPWVSLKLPFGFLILLNFCRPTSKSVAGTTLLCLHMHHKLHVACNFNCIVETYLSWSISQFLRQGYELSETGAWNVLLNGKYIFLLNYYRISLPLVMADAVLLTVGLFTHVIPVPPQISWKCTHVFKLTCWQIENINHRIKMAAVINSTVTLHHATDHEMM